MKTNFRHVRFIAVKSALAAVLIGGAVSAGSATTLVIEEPCVPSRQYPNLCSIAKPLKIAANQPYSFSGACSKVDQKTPAGFIRFQYNSGNIDIYSSPIGTKDMLFAFKSPVEFTMVKASLICFLSDAKASGTLTLK